MDSEEKPKLEMIENRGEEAEISAEQLAYEKMQARSRRRHPSALPHLAEIETVGDEQLDE